MMQRICFDDVMGQMGLDETISARCWDYIRQGSRLLPQQLVPLITAGIIRLNNVRNADVKNAFSVVTSILFYDQVLSVNERRLFYVLSRRWGLSKFQADMVFLAHLTAFSMKYAPETGEYVYQDGLDAEGGEADGSAAAGSFSAREGNLNRGAVDGSGSESEPGVRDASGAEAGVRYASGAEAAAGAGAGGKTAEEVRSESDLADGNGFDQRWRRQAELLREQERLQEEYRRAQEEDRRKVQEERKKRQEEERQRELKRRQEEFQRRMEESRRQFQEDQRRREESYRRAQEEREKESRRQQKKRSWWWNRTDDEPDDGLMSLAEAYRTLQCGHDDSDELVRQAWRRLVGRYHPDRAASRAADAEEIARCNAIAAKINAAWDVVRKKRGL